MSDSPSVVRCSANWARRDVHCRAAGDRHRAIVATILWLVERANHIYAGTSSIGNSECWSARTQVKWIALGMSRAPTEALQAICDLDLSGREAIDWLHLAAVDDGPRCTQRYRSTAVYLNHHITEAVCAMRLNLWRRTPAFALKYSFLSRLRISWAFVGSSPSPILSSAESAPGTRAHSSNHSSATGFYRQLPGWVRPPLVNRAVGRTEKCS